jgi:DNA-binding GntR family transcriptional regulator
MEDNRTRAQADTDSTLTCQQQAYEFVKAQIMNLDLKAGQYLTDSQVAETLNISRTPVREALRRLEQEGLLINEARRGWKVYALSLDDIREIFQIKELMEGMMVRKAAGCKDEELRAGLRDAMERLNLAAAGSSYEAWRQADGELHRVIYAMCHNQRACDIVQSLNDQWFRLRAGFVTLEGRMERSNREHEAVVESILAGDGDEAERLMRRHLNNVREELVHVLRIVLPFVQDGV